MNNTDSCAILHEYVILKASTLLQSWENLSPFHDTVTRLQKRFETLSNLPLLKHVDMCGQGHVQAQPAFFFYATNNVNRHLYLH